MKKSRDNQCADIDSTLDYLIENANILRSIALNVMADRERPSFDQMRKEDGDDDGEDGSRDTLYDQARSIVLETQTASTTFLQRKLKIGYARAASLMDELETRGVIGPQEGSKPRQIFQPKNLS